MFRFEPENSAVSIDELPQTPTLVVVPPGHTGRLFLPEAPNLPPNVTQTVALDDIRSLGLYLRKMVTDPHMLVIFVDISTMKITAVIDHAENHDKPGTNTHLAVTQAVWSHEFKPLHDVLNKKLTQDDFLTFLDRQGHLFLQAAELREICANFACVTIERVKQIVNTRNGTGKFIVDTAEKTDDEISVPPASIQTVVPLFPGSLPCELTVQIRYRAPGGKLEFTLLIPELETIKKQEFQKLEDQVAQFRGGMAELNPAEPAVAWLDAPVLRAPLPTLKACAATVPAREIEISGGELPNTLDMGDAVNLADPLGFADEPEVEAAG